MNCIKYNSVFCGQSQLHSFKFSVFSIISLEYQSRIPHLIAKHLFSCIFFFFLLYYIGTLEIPVDFISWFSDLHMELTVK